MSTRGTDLFDKIHEYGIDLKRRRVFLNSGFYHSKPADFEDATGETDFVIRNLLWLDQSPGPIELWINSPGGSADEMWAVYDVIQTRHNDVITVGYGIVASAACIVLAGGTGTRYAMPNVSFMWHGGWDGPAGNTQEIIDRAEFYKRERARWCETMARHSAPPGHKSMKAKTGFWMKKTLAREEWLDASDMLTYGVVDALWTKE